MKTKWGKDEPRDKISYRCPDCRRNCQITVTISPGELNLHDGSSGVDAFLSNVRDVMCDMLEGGNTDGKI